MNKFIIEPDYWNVTVDGEEWLVKGSSVKDVISKVLVEVSDGDIDTIERTNIIKVLV